MSQRRWSAVLASGIVCLLCMLLTAGQGGPPAGAWKAGLFYEIQKSAEQLWMPGIGFGTRTVQKKSWKERTAFLASQILPIGGFVVQGAVDGHAPEDEDTYAMLLKRQAEDENSVDEDGNLIAGGNRPLEEGTPQTAGADLSIEKLRDFTYLTEHFYTVDSVTMVTPEDLNVDEYLAKDMRIDPEQNGPKVLIFHTHSQERFVDSNEDPSTSIIGIGRYLTQLLNETYDIPTLHHEGVFDLINGKLDRSQAYELAEPEIRRILQENPSIEVVIDLHRDGVPDTTHLVTEIKGKPAAQIMFFNGMCRTRENGDLSSMLNPHLRDNLAFSLQMKLEAERRYPGFTRRIYLKGYRYNMDLMPKMLLIEAGAQTNTVEEMKNAMEPLAEILNEVLQ